MAISQVETILAKCKGQRVNMPILFNLSPTWKPCLNAKYNDSVEAAVEKWRRRWLPDTESYVRNVTVNGAFFARTTNPEASVVNLQIMAMYAAWVFAWDDPIDFGELDESERNLYCTESIEIVRSSILEDRKIDPAETAPTFPLAQSFYEIGQLMGKCPGLAPIRKFVSDTLCDYMDAAMEVQNPIEEGHVVSLEKYLGIREQSSGVYPTIAISLYCQGVAIPAWFVDHAVVKQMMKHAVLMVALDNDVVSACKETQNNHIDNIIPLLVYHKGLKPQSAVDYTCQLIADNYLSFKKLEPKLLRLALEENVVDCAQVFINCCKNVRVGLVNWSYTISRYGKLAALNGDEEVSVVLGQ